MKFEVTHVVPHLSANRGGPSRSVWALAKAQASQRPPVALATIREQEAMPEPDQLHLQGGRADRPRAFGCSRELRDFLRRTSTQVIHHHALWLRTLHYAHDTAHRSGVPLVLSPRGMMNRWAWHHHRTRKAFAAAVVHPGALRGTTAWHATSNQEADDIRRLGFTQPICVSPNGVEVPTEAQRAIAREHWLQRMPQLPERRVALFYSRFHSKKRVIELIDLWLRLNPADWQLMLVGIPEQFSVSQLQNYLLRSLAGDRILIADGMQQPPPYAVASLFLLPSHSENFGLSIAEALASGVPALVTDSTPWAELNANTGGWCVPWEQYPATLAAALKEDPAALAHRGAIAREWVAAHFSWQQEGRRLLEFYTSLRR